MATFLINFKPQFLPMIESGAKRQTIRRHREDGRRMQPGDKLRLYTGLRTRKARCVREAVVKRCRSIRLDIPGLLLIVDGERLGIGPCIEFALADGFSSFAEFCAFFRDQYGVEEFGVIGIACGSFHDGR